MTGLTGNNAPAGSSAPLPLRLYSVAVRILFLALLPLAWFMPRVRPQLKDRWTPTRLRRLMDNGPVDALFFCSSAGEFEQAVPVLDRLAATGRRSVVCFFSASGEQFLRAKGYRYAYVMAPLDTIGNWNDFFRALRPKAVIVVRHELWPAFCFVASSQSSLFVINMTRPAKISRLKDRLKAFFLRRASYVSAVDAESLDYVQGLLACSGRLSDAGNLHLIPDTKFDRLLDRRAEVGTKDLKRGEPDARLKNVIDFCHPSVFIVGSAWPADVSVALTGFVETLKESAGFSITLCLVPHEPTPACVADYVKKAESFGLSALTLQQAQLLGTDGNRQEFGKKSENAGFSSTRLQVLVIDCLGLLADLYRIGSMAMVGGASHHKVHNVIEPAAWGLPLCFGPRFRNAPEAAELVEKGLAEVVRAPADIRLFIRKATAAGAPDPRLLEHVRSKAGAADSLASAISAVIR